MMIQRHALLAAIAFAFAFSALEPAFAQQIERPTDCEEVMTAGAIFIGHNCGELASIMINGRIIIRRPWSRVNRASRAERLRAGGATATAETAAPPTGGTGGTATGTSSLSCSDFVYQEDAQAYFDSQGWSATNDPFGLDDSGEGDGVPCESLPTRNG